MIFLTVNVRCTHTEMIIRYNPRNYFQGRMYAENHPEDCAVAGSNHGPTFLTLPIDLVNQRCGINRAFDYESPNRTLIYVYIIIQQNPLVQMQSDRYIKVGCIANSIRIPEISLETSMAFNKNAFEGKLLLYFRNISLLSISPIGDGTLVIDRSFEYPMLNIYIVDPLTDEILKEARIGQMLKFIISKETNFDNYDIRAINLTASSGQEHLELINQHGCPINPTIFPALQPEKTEIYRRLVTKFKAFKFVSSPKIKFSVAIQFCYENCAPRNCGNGIISEGRKKRESSAGIVNKSPSPLLDRIIFPDESTALPLKSSPTLEPIKFPETPEKLVSIRTDTLGNPQGIQQYFGNENDFPNNEIPKTNIVAVPLDITLNILEPKFNDDDTRFVFGENDQILVGNLGKVFF